jgi:hypothetical protein
VEFTGRLGSVPLAELLQWPFHERRSGSLVVRTARREKRVLFERGMIVGCQSGDPAEYFGQFLLLNGYLKRDKLLEALSVCRAAGVRLGTALVDLGHLSPDAAAWAVAKHIEERVCDLFLWKHGVFYFDQELPEMDRLTEPLDPLAVALEGSRWADENERIRQLLVHDGVVLKRGGDVPEDATVLEKRVLEVVQRAHRLDELYAIVHGSYFRFLQAVYRLLAIGALEVEGLEDEREAKSEIRMFDLLLEQAATEDVLFSARHLSLPLEWFDRFFPLWMESEEPGSASDEELQFYRQMDGTRSLKELVLAHSDLRQERMDMVLLQLQNGNLALLPRSVDELQSKGRKRSAWLKKLLG